VKLCTHSFTPVMIAGEREIGDALGCQAREKFGPDLDSSRGRAGSTSALACYRQSRTMGHARPNHPGAR